MTIRLNVCPSRATRYRLCHIEHFLVSATGTCLAFIRLEPKERRFAAGDRKSPEPGKPRQWLTSAASAGVRVGVRDKEKSLHLCHGSSRGVIDATHIVGLMR